MELLHRDASIRLEVFAPNASCERVDWHEAQARSARGEPGFGWDTYAQQCVRVTITGPTTVGDLISIRIARCTYGGNGDPEDVCRVWLCATIPDRQTFVIINEMIMRPAGFTMASAIDVTGMPLLKIAELAVLQGLGDELQNWTKSMSKAEYEALSGA